MTMLNHVALIYIFISVGCALIIDVDIFHIGRRQLTKIMDAVWPLTTLYLGPMGLVAYYWFGRARRHNKGQQQRHDMHHHGMHEGNYEKPMWQAAFLGSSQCGAGCALGDFIGERLASGMGITLFGSALGATYLFAFLLAYVFGIIFQYFSVAPMQVLNLRDGLIRAIKFGTVPLLAYEVGMFAWIAFRAWHFPTLLPPQWGYWSMLQIALMIGFATAYPLNWWRIARRTSKMI